MQLIRWDFKLYLCNCLFDRKDCSVGGGFQIWNYGPLLRQSVEKCIPPLLLHFPSFAKFLHSFWIMMM